MKKQLIVSALLVLITATLSFAQDSEVALDYKLLATTKTSTMQKELNEEFVQ